MDDLVSLGSQWTELPAAYGARGMTREAVARALHRVFGNSGSDHADKVWAAIWDEAAKD